jgi:hypothetical protein
MRNWLRMRDAKCPFPGCSNHFLDNEADHLLAWHHGGTTGISNLGQPCPWHHMLKHASGWRPTPATKNEPPGWISRSGRKYKSEHQDWEPPRWPRLLAPQASARPYPPMPTAQGGTVDSLQRQPRPHNNMCAGLSQVSSGERRSGSSRSRSHKGESSSLVETDRRRVNSNGTRPTRSECGQLERNRVK